MGTKKRVNKYAKAFRLMALERMKNCESVSALAEELGIHRTVLYHWKNYLKAMEGTRENSPSRVFPRHQRDARAGQGPAALMLSLRLQRLSREYEESCCLQTKLLIFDIEIR